MLKKELEEELQRLKSENERLKRENEELKEKLDTKVNTIRDLFSEVQELNKENKQLKANAPVERKHNERGAGRKNKFTGDMIIFVTTLKGYGYTYLEIKQKFWERYGKNISVGSISSIIKENS